MEYKFTVPGRLEGLNNYTAANRTNPYKGGKVKMIMRITSCGVSDSSSMVYISKSRY